MYKLLFLLTTCWCLSALAKSVLYYDPENAHIHFEEFINEYNKQYVDENEKQARLEIFKKNLEKVNSLNEKYDSAEFGITQFMDSTYEELTANTGLRNATFETCSVVKHDEDIPDAGAPDSFDWREKNAVTPVKNEGVCYANYAFTAIGHLESQYFLVKNQPLQEFSAQQIIDCDNYDVGCGGGLVSHVYRYLMRLGGPMKQADYPFEGKEGDCRSNKDKVIPKVQGCFSYNLHKQESVKQLLYKVGPIPVAVDDTLLFFYKKGIVPDIECYGPRIFVLLVGYGIEDGEPYWIMKHSLGTRFGEKGYFRMHRSDNRRGACCMLNLFMTTAVVA